MNRRKAWESEGNLDSTLSKSFDVSNGPDHPQSKTAFIKSKFSYTESQPTLPESELTFLKSKLDLVKSNLTPVKSNLTPVKSKLPFIKSNLAFEKSNLSFDQSQFAFVGSHLSFEKSNLDPVKSILSLTKDRPSKDSGKLPLIKSKPFVNNDLRAHLSREIEFWQEKFSITILFMEIDGLKAARDRLFFAQYSSV